MSPEMEALYRAELAKIEAWPAPRPNGLARARSRREAYRTERELPKAVEQPEPLPEISPTSLALLLMAQGFASADNNRRQKP